MTETIFYNQQNLFLLSLYFAVNNFNWRIGFSGHVKLRFLSSPDINNSPFHLSVSTIIKIRFIDPSPDCTAKSTLCIPDIIPENTDAFAPVASDVWISSHLLTVVAGHMYIFVMKHRYIFSRCASHT